jgi:hypothetical protein
MTTLILTPEVQEELRRRMAEIAQRILDGKPIWTQEEIKEGLREPIPGLLRRQSASGRRSGDR